MTLIPGRLLRASTRDQLWALWRQLDASGVDFDYEFDSTSVAADYTRRTLLRVLATARIPSLVFGEASVVVEKRRSTLSWTVATPPPEAKPLVTIHWRHVYDWTDLLTSTDAGHLLAALAVAMSVCPLDADDLAALEGVWPGISAQSTFPVPRAREWEVVDPEPESEPEPAPEPAPEPDPVPGPATSLFAPRKLSPGPRGR